MDRGAGAPAAPGRERRLVGGAMLIAAAGLAAWLQLGGPPAQPARVSVAAFNVACQTSVSLVLNGAISDCAGPARPGHPVCTLPEAAGHYTFSGRLHGAKRDYLLYVEIPGSYRGAQTYTLLPWPDHSFGTGDLVPRVAVRVFIGGALWRSTDGAVTIAPDGGSGEVKAILTGGEDPSGQPTQLTLLGHWKCG
jgi:hypothetical protein